MASNPVRPWYVLLLIALYWPLKVVMVYFWTCGADIAAALASEWRGRPRYTGWER